MPNIEIIISLFILLVGIRTLSWHLQCWQLREYRFDRMKAWLNTKDGKSYFVPWFSKGLFPRPKKSGRIVLILVGVALLSTIFLTFFLLPYGISKTYFPDSRRYLFYLGGGLFLWERTLWLQVLLSVWVSKFPVWVRKKRLFAKATKIISKAPKNLTCIGITGSYGKSSTKELLVHLLVKEFGEKNILFNPENNNTEVAIARLIIKNREFFDPATQDRNSKNSKFLVIETGAYKKGEIATVADIIKPYCSILTGLNQQHLELFGSIQNIGEAKFELAERTKKTVIFNADSPYLVRIFNDKDIKATKVPLQFSIIKNLEAFPNKTNFEAYGMKFVLRWSGKFFVQNALLAMECAREVGVKKENLPKYLKSLKPLKRALSLEVHKQGFTLLKDTYSANPDGVLQAIEHLKNFSGKRIFVSIPLRELGGDALSVHKQIFEKLKSVKAEVYWEKDDFSELGKKVLGDKFHLIKKNKQSLEKLIKTLKKEDVVLLESKLSKGIMDLFG